MKLQTFSAGTMADALRQLKVAMGEDAVILHTRTYARRRWLGLRRQEVVEITAGSGMDVAARTPRRTAAAKTAPDGLATAGAGRAALAAVASRERTETVVAGGHGAKHALRSSSGPAQLLQTPAASSAMMLGLSEQVSAIRDIVMDLVRETRAQRAPSVPEELFDQYLQLIQNQVAEELAAEVVKDLKGQLRAEHLRNADFVRDKLAEQLERMLPVSGPITRTKQAGPHVVALIGPTGVGKTTTIAKLAANLKLRENHRVGLVTIDTYRIAAVDQLKRYADILGSPLRVVSTPEDLSRAVASFDDCDFVLIDTAGRSPTDTLKLNELRNFLVAAAPDEVHLVLSTTASQACIEAAIARFAEVRVDKIIFTKLDEAVHVGVVLNVIRKVNKSLSYITTGQDVPEDIEVGRGRRLAQLILGGQP